jgi:hypothetical protein
MPKAARRKSKGNPASKSTVTVNASRSSTIGTIGGQSGRGAKGMSSYQGLLMPGLVALGCWGLAISFAFFSTDPNRLIWGGMAALMGVMWSFSLWRRLRKL